MRKLIWGCVAGGAVVACCAVWAAHHAAHHPRSVIGRVLHGASHAAAYANPYTGFSAVLARLKSANDTKPDEVAIDVEGLPGEPTPEGEPEVPAAAGPIDAPKDAAPIVIPETERPEAPPIPDAVEVPPSDGPAAPATMPPAGDAEESELPMPRLEETDEVEVRGWWQTVADWFKGGKCCHEETDVFECTPLPGGGECREDENHHRHYPGCPATGRTPCGKGGRPAAMPPRSMKDGGEEPSEERTRSPALKAIRRLKTRTLIPEDRGPVAPGVDTMELRKSDLPLSDYGPGVL